MKYFLFANTEKKPVMRFFDHWFEVSDFLTLMHWDKSPPALEIYHKMDKKKWNKGMERDLDKEPYTKEEQRVCDYLQMITKNQIGCGDDPIGFLIASHNAMRLTILGVDPTL